ncbi:YgaP family membrane protein [Sedimenticola sp.]|uniref:YgaP family membrane protein n=1 Tax=Sedimenticola sp. TaxID=1940285 RepID=UPI003D13DC10
MKKNVGSIDRGLRALVGLGLIAWGLAEQNWWGAIGIIPLFTAAIGWCPAYLPFGLSSCKTDK